MKNISIIGILKKNQQILSSKKILRIYLFRITQLELRQMMKMSHNVCYRKHPSREVVCLGVFRIPKNHGFLYVRVYFDASAGIWFYSVRASDLPHTKIIFSTGFFSDREVCDDVRAFARQYVSDEITLNSINPYMLLKP